MYFTDILRIFLIDSLLKLEYEPLVMIILEKILQENGVNFYQKLHTFLMKQQLFIGLCTILDIYMQLKGRLDGTKRRPPISPQQLKEDENFNFEHIQEVFEDALNEYEEQSWDKMVQAILDELILDCYPDLDTIERLEGIQKVAALLEKLFGMLGNFGNQIKLQNLSILRFWADFTQLPISKIREIHYLIQSSNLAQKLDEQNEVDKQNQKKKFLDYPEFIEDIFYHFKEYNEEKIMKFLCSFMSIIIDRDSTHLLMVADNFEIRGNEIYNYSTLIFQNILAKSKLVQSIDDYEELILQEDNVDQYSDIALQYNDYLENLEMIFNKQGITSKFGIIICDVLIKKYLINGVNHEMVEQNFKCFKNYMSIIKRTDLETYPQTQKLLANTMIKCYLDAYALIIVKLQNLEKDEYQEEFSLSQEEKQILEEVDQIICDSPLMKTLQVYCFKKIKQLLNYSLSQLKIFCQDKLINQYQYKWATEFDLGELEQQLQLPVDILPQYDECSEIERRIIYNVNNIIKNGDLNSKGGLIKQMQETLSDNQRISVGLAFMKGIYLMYTLPDHKESHNLRTFFNEELEQILEVRLGKEYTALISLFISNFPPSNFFRLDYKLMQNDIHKKIVGCMTLIIILSFKSSQNPLVGQFFKNGIFNPNQIRESYLSGLELPFKTEYILTLYENFNILKSDTWNTVYKGAHAKGSAYKCADDCDYVYIVQDCGVLVPTDCPWCKKKIGGEHGHKIYERPGHQNLTDAEAKAYLLKQYEKLIQNMPNGYNPVNTAIQNSIMTFNQLQPLTFRLLGCFLHVFLYFMQTIGTMSDKQLYDIFTTRNEEENKDQNLLKEMRIDPKIFLKQHVSNDLEMIFTQLSSGGQDSPAPWLYYVFGEFIKKINTINLYPSTTKIRSQFEKFFDVEIIVPYITKISEIAQQQRSKQMKNSKEFDQLVSEIIIEEAKDDCLNLKLFRLTRDFSFQDMRASFYMNPQNSKEFKMLKCLLDNNDDLLRLKKFYPIIEFTNYLLNRFSHMITRQDSRTILIKDIFQDKAEDKISRDMFNRFLQSWNNLGFSKKIQYGCKVLDYFSKHNETSELIYFLLDNKEPGGGMCMAAGLNELTEIQNTILRELVDTYCSEKNISVDFIVDTFKYPVQRVKANHIIDITIDDKQVLKASSLNNIKYGEGEKLVYDFARIQLILTKEILNKKFLRVDNLEFIQYQLELITITGDKSALIIEIRQKIEQQPLEKEMQIKVDLYFEQMSKRNQAEFQTSLKQLHGALEKILCFLLNAKIKPDNTLEEFCSTMRNNIDQRFKTTSILAQVQLRNIVSLYEQIEKLYFPFITTHLRQEYFREDQKDDIREHMKRILDDTDKKVNNCLPSRQQIQNALMRFMIRCLAADLNVEQPLSYYIMREDFWDKDIGETKLDRFSEVFPASINLDHTAVTYRIIDELNQTAEKKSLAPKMNERPQPRKVEQGQKLIHKKRERDIEI